MPAEGLLGLSLQHFEQEAELGDLYRLAVAIDAVDVVEEDAFSFGGGEAVGGGVAEEDGFPLSRE